MVSWRIGARSVDEERREYRNDEIESQGGEGQTKQGSKEIKVRPIKAVQQRQGRSRETFEKLEAVGRRWEDGGWKDSLRVAQFS